MDPWLAVPPLAAAIAYFSKGLDWLSAITGAIMGYMVLFLGGWQWLAILILFFALSTAATHYKYGLKAEYRVSQKKRTVENVLGNGLAPLIFAMQGNVYGFAASMATATADTLSSEIGVLSKKPPVSILDFKTEMKRGDNGGVTTLGNTAMLCGASAIALACLAFYGSWQLFWITLWSSIFGCVVDSVLGATLENERIIGNHVVNFLATLSGGLFAIALSTIT